MDFTSDKADINDIERELRDFIDERDFKTVQDLPEHYQLLHRLVMESFTRLIHPKLRIPEFRAFVSQDDVSIIQKSLALRPMDYAWPNAYMEPASYDEGVSYYKKKQMLPSDPAVKEHLIITFPLNKGATPALPLDQDPVAQNVWASTTLEERNMCLRLLLNYRKARIYCRAQYPPFPAPKQLPADRRLGAAPPANILKELDWNTSNCMQVIHCLTQFYSSILVPSYGVILT